MVAFLGIVLAFINVILWGVSDIITKASLDRESKWKVLFIGQFFGGLLVFIIAILLGDVKNLLSSEVSYLILLALLNLVGVYAFYEAFQKKGVALTSPIIYSYVIITVILGVIFYSETVNTIQSLAIILILGGIFIVMSKKTERIAFDKFFMFAILSMVIWGVLYFLLKVPNLIFGAILVTSSIKLFTSFFSIPVLVTKKIKIFKLENKVLPYMLLIGVLDAMGFLAFNSALNFSPVSIVTAISSAAPILSVSLGVIILKESLTRKQTIGIATAILGLILISIF